MILLRKTTLTLALAASIGTCATLSRAASPAVSLTPISSVLASEPGVSAAEIVAHDPETQRLFVVNAVAAKIDVYIISDPANPRLFKTIDVKPFGAVANSVSIKNGIAAVAVEADPKTSPGRVVFFKTSSLKALASVQVGAQPDMVTFSPDGRYVLTANEGEPAGDYSVDPEGSVSIIDISGGLAKLTQEKVRTAHFEGFNSYSRSELFAEKQIRVFGPAGTVAQNLEPEYITVSSDSQTAWVTLQENNALAKIDLSTAKVVELLGLGTKDHNLAVNGFGSSNALDGSDRDGGKIPDPKDPGKTIDSGKINIRNWPVSGFYLPDSMGSYTVGGDTFLVLANEGDAREWSAYDEQARVSNLQLNSTAFPNRSALQNSTTGIGRLRTTTAHGATDVKQIYTFGTRSFSIRTAAGELVWDSGDQFERKTAELYPQHFNASNSNNTFDDRSDDKGPEPEGIAVGEAYGRTFAFIGLERIGGVVVYDVTNPTSPTFADYVNNRDFSKPVTDVASGDLGPEGLIFIAPESSPNGKPLVVVANEVSGTTTIFQLDLK